MTLSQQRPLRPRPCEHANAQQYPQQQAGEILRWLCGGNGAVVLTGFHATSKEVLGTGQEVIDDFLRIGVMRRGFQRRVHHHAASMLWIAHRAIDDFHEKHFNGLTRCHHAFQSSHTFAEAAFQIVRQRLAI
jgi:hypothetical protein